jgi:hypothetical protein
MLDNGTMVEGKVMALDSGKAIVNTGFGITDVYLKEIKAVQKLSTNEGALIVYGETKKSDKSFISLGSGAIIASTTSEYFPYEGGDQVNPGFDVSVSYGSFSGRASAYRVSFSFSSMSNRNADDNTHYSITRSGGSTMQLDLGFSYMIGLFKPEFRVNPYVFGGLGLGNMNSTSITETYNYTNYQINGQDFNPDGQMYYKISFGGGTFYRLSKKQALQLDISYDIMSIASGFYSDMNQIRVKAAFVFLNF